MARIVIEQITDDLDGSTNAAPVAFSFDGTDYAIDLSPKNKKAMEKVLKPYLESATKAAGPRSRAKRARGGSKSRTGTDLAAVRKWLRDNGHEVSGRGRISADLQKAYDAAH